MQKHISSLKGLCSATKQKDLVGHSSSTGYWVILSLFHIMLCLRNPLISHVWLSRLQHGKRITIDRCAQKKKSLCAQAVSWESQLEPITVQILIVWPLAQCVQAVNICEQTQALDNMGLKRQVSCAFCNYLLGLGTTEGIFVSILMVFFGLHLQ